MQEFPALADRLCAEQTVFESPGALLALGAMSSLDFDRLDFGVVEMDLNGFVTAYNRHESEMAGLAIEDVIGKHFFREVAPCTNNHLLAGLFDLADAVDETIPYIFTLKGEIVEVRLRLLKAAALGSNSYLLNGFSR